MTIFYTKEADHVQWGPVDGTFDLPILAQLRAYLEDYAWLFPDERLYRRFVEAIKGLIACRVPIVAQIAAAVIQSYDPRRTSHVAKRYYRWLDNPRLDHRSLLKPAYAQTQQWFGDQTDRFIVNLDEEFIIRLYLNRTLELQRGRARTEKLLEEVIKETRRPIRFQAWFKVRGRWRKCPVTLGYRKVWLPGHHQPY
jgi:hypothetical protein